MMTHDNVIECTCRRCGKEYGLIVEDERDRDGIRHTVEHVARAHLRECRDAVVDLAEQSGPTTLRIWSIGGTPSVKDVVN